MNSFEAKQLGFKEKSYRPWPTHENTQFFTVDNHSAFLDLLYHREKDGAAVYLGSIKK